MYLPVLDRNPTIAAPWYADVHLNNLITLLAQLFSTAVQETVPEQITYAVTRKGIQEILFQHYDTPLLPPTRHPVLRPWIDWIKSDYQRAWWFVTMAWSLDKERIHRFGVGQHPDHVRFNLWVQNGTTRVFEKTHKGITDFPLVFPINTTVSYMHMDSIKLYQEFYKGLQKNHRMKWTKREKPEWMGGPKVTSLVTPIHTGGVTCKQCSPTTKVALPPLTGCGLPECPWKFEQMVKKEGENE